MGQTNVTKTQLWKVQSRPDCASKKVEQAQNHDELARGTSGSREARDLLPQSL